MAASANLLRSRGFHVDYLGDAHEARLNLKELLASCDLDEPQRTIETFNDEYLIRVSENGCHVEGYHSIRSDIISKKLTDPIVCPWSEVASRALPLIVEDDLQSFLLCASLETQVRPGP